jgi:hypothetical protein
MGRETGLVSQLSGKEKTGVDFRGRFVSTYQPAEAFYAGYAVHVADSE